MKNIKKYTFFSLLISLEIIMTRFLQFSIPGVFQDRISLGFIPVAVAGTLYGATGGFIVGGMGDFLRAIILPQGGAINLLFTLNAAIRGGVYGLILRKNVNVWTVMLSGVIILLQNIFLMAFIMKISMFPETPYFAIVYQRLIVSFSNFVVQTVVLSFILKPIARKLDYVRK